MKLAYKNIIGIVITLIVFVQFSATAQDTLDIKEIEPSVDKYLNYFTNNNPGAVVSVIKDGEIIFNKAYGLANVKENELMTINKTFNIAELSKSFTSLTILKLVEKNKLDLENNLKDIFPDFPEYGRNIKIINLLNHTSGLPAYNKDEVTSNNEVYEFLRKQTATIFEPGRKWQHSNSDYAILVKVIEKISGMTYQDFLHKNIFKKLSMNNTFFANEISNQNIAKSHFKENDKYAVKEDFNAIYGEQGIYTNSLDFAKWDKALYSDKLLKCENLSRIFSVDKVNFGNIVSFYGYGWVLMEKNGVRYYWHGGSKYGYSNLFLHLPDTHISVLILTNRNDGYDFLKMSIYIAKLFDKNLKL